MDLPLILESLGITENVSPDLSSYEAMVANWRGSMAPPNKAAIEAKSVEIEKLLSDQKPLEDQEIKIKDDGVTDLDRINALWLKAKGDSTEFDRIDGIIENAKVLFPEKT